MTKVGRLTNHILEAFINEDIIITIRRIHLIWNIEGFAQIRGYSIDVAVLRYGIG